MSGQTSPTKHEVVFTLSDSGKARADALLARCGHRNMALMIARGLALVEWVEDQLDQGRAVAGITYGAGDDGEALFAELQERPELLMPPQRAITAPAAPIAPKAAVSAPVQIPTPPAVIDAPAPRKARQATPAPIAQDATTNPKLMPRERRPPPPKPAPRPRNPNRRAEKLTAHIPDDNGPIKTFRWVRWKAESTGRLPPIPIGDERVLPGELNLGHLAELQRFTVEARHVTHFRITDDGDLSFYGYAPNKGWCYAEQCSMQLHKDAQCAGGLFAIFPIVMAVEYLQRLANPPRAMAAG